MAFAAAGAGQVDSDLSDEDSSDDDYIPGAAAPLLATAVAREGGGSDEEGEEEDGGGAAVGLGEAWRAGEGMRAAIDGEDEDDAAAFLPEPAGGGVLHDARWALQQVFALPPITRLWLLLLFAAGVLCALRPATKETLAMHWPRAMGTSTATENSQPWRFATNFLALGGEFLSFHTLIGLGMIFESIAPYERLLSVTRKTAGGGRISLPFLCLFCCGAAALLASQHWGVRGGLYRAAGAEALVHPRPRPWLSHDLTFLLLCVSCWDRPTDLIVLGFVPGLPPLPRWQFPFAMSVIHVMLAGSVRAVYTEAILCSVPCHLAVNVLPMLPMLGGSGRGWSGGWQPPRAPHPHQD